MKKIAAILLIITVLLTVFMLPEKTQVGAISSTDEALKDNIFISTQTSFLGLKNTGDLTDNGSRFYILPKDHVTSGTGGALKIFADDFSVDTKDYRDLGIYFSADQNKETGLNNTGAFYINSKVSGEYAFLNPDIIFSFQDGEDIGGRFSRIVNSARTSSRAVFVIGEGKPTVSLIDNSIVGEVQGNLGFKNGTGIYTLNKEGTALNGIIYYTRYNKWRIQAQSGMETYIGKSLKVSQTVDSTIYNSAIIEATLKTYKSTKTTLSALGTNNIELSQSEPTVITSISGGTQGQELMLYFKNDNTTIKNNSTIHLSGANDFTGTQYDILTLLYTSDGWVEKSRSVN